MSDSDPAGVDRDQRGRHRDHAAAQRDIDAAIRDAVADDGHLSEREREARLAAQEDRDAAATDRRDAADDRRAAQEERDAAGKEWRVGGDVPSEDREVLDLVVGLQATGNLHPLVALLRDGQIGPERARDALKVLGEADLDQLVQIALDTLIAEYVADPGLAHQPRRDRRGDA